jgi:hypothetical protein
MNRRGAALILALVILALMLVLGVPFVQSQNLGFSDARRTNLSRALNTYSLSTEDLAVSLLSNAQSRLAGGESFHLGTGLKDLSNDRARYQDGAWVIDGQTVRDVFGLSVPPEQAVSLSDTGARIDINALDARAWDTLLENVLGPGADWDDDLVTNDGEVYQPANNIEDDPNSHGELAEALAARHYRTVAELLTVRRSPANSNFRQQLTAWEYRQLAPLLTVHPIQPGRRLASAGQNYTDELSGNIIDEHSRDGRYRPLDIGSLVFREIHTSPDGTQRWRAYLDTNIAHRPITRHQAVHTEDAVWFNVAATTNGGTNNPPDWSNEAAFFSVEAPRLLNPFAVTERQHNFFRNLHSSLATYAGDLNDLSLDQTDPLRWGHPDFSDAFRDLSRSTNWNVAMRSFATHLNPQFRVFTVSSGVALQQSHTRPGAPPTTRLTDSLNRQQQRTVQVGYGGDQLLNHTWQTHSDFQLLADQLWTSNMVAGPIARWRWQQNPPGYQQLAAGDARLVSRPLPGYDQYLTGNPEDSLILQHYSDATTITDQGLSGAFSFGNWPVEDNRAASAEWQSWITPTAAMTTGAHVIWQGVGKTWNGTDSGSNNALTLWYDADLGHLVFSVTPPNAFGNFASSGFSAGDTSLGNNDLNDPSATANPALTNLGFNRPETWRHLEHRYVIGDWQANESKHLHLIVEWWGPGGIRLAVDGSWGRNVTGHDSTTTVIGDWETLPAFSLETRAEHQPPTEVLFGLASNWADESHLDFTTVFLNGLNTTEDAWLRQQAIVAGNYGALETLTLQAGPIARQLDPENMLDGRGTLTINNEVISYTDAVWNPEGTWSLTGLQRGMRQDTDQSEDPANPGSYNKTDERYPVVHTHWQGDVALPGGLNVLGTGSEILTGWAGLADEWRGGESDLSNPGYFQTNWAEVQELSTTTISYPLPLPEDETLTIGRDQIWGDQATDTLTLSLPPDQTERGFPAQGIIKLIAGNTSAATNAGPTYIYNELNRTGAAVTLSGLTLLTDYDYARNDTLTRPTLFIGAEEDVRAVLIGIPTTIDNFDNWLRPERANDRDYLVALSDAAGEEWVTYTHLHRHQNTAFLIHQHGWGPLGRGALRTPAREGAVWDTQAVLKPVQTGLQSGHMLVTGDRITWLPIDLASGSQPMITTVRLRLQDHLPVNSDPTDTPPLASYDSHNHYWTSLEAFPSDLAPFSPSAYVLQVNQGWGPIQDDSPVSRNQAALRFGPAPYGNPDNDDFVIELLTGSTSEPIPPIGPSSVQWMAVAADNFTLSSRSLGWRDSGFRSQLRPFARDIRSETPSSELDSLDKESAVFIDDIGNNAQLRQNINIGLLGDETVLYERSGNDALLLLRGLHHSLSIYGTPERHTPLITPNQQLRAGQVAELSSDRHLDQFGTSVSSPITADFQGFMAVAGNFENQHTEHWLLVKPGPWRDHRWMHEYEIIAARSITTLGNGVGLAIAPWLRGMYGSQPIEEIDGSVFVIPFFPRYAAALPPLSASYLNDLDDVEALVRCRFYQWASFTLAGNGLYLANDALQTVTDSTLPLTWQQGAISGGVSWFETPSSPRLWFDDDIDTDGNVLSNNGFELRLWPRYESTIGNDAGDFLESVRRRSNTRIAIERVSVDYDLPTRVLEAR